MYIEHAAWAGVENVSRLSDDPTIYAVLASRGAPVWGAKVDDAAWVRVLVLC